MIAPRARFWGAAGLLFVVWLAALALGGRGSGMDLAIYQELYVAAGTTLGRNAVVFTRIGGGVFLSILALIAAGWLVFRGRKRRTALLLIMVFGGRFLVELQ